MSGSFLRMKQLGQLEAKARHDLLAVQRLAGAHESRGPVAEPEDSRRRGSGSIHAAKRAREAGAPGWPMGPAPRHASVMTPSRSRHGVRFSVRASDTCRPWAPVLEGGR